MKNGGSEQNSSSSAAVKLVEFKLLEQFGLVQLLPSTEVIFVELKLLFVLLEPVLLLPFIVLVEFRPPFVLFESVLLLLDEKLVTKVPLQLNPAHVPFIRLVVDFIFGLQGFAFVLFFTSVVKFS